MPFQARCAVVTRHEAHDGAVDAIRKVLATKRSLRYVEMNHFKIQLFFLHVVGFETNKFCKATANSVLFNKVLLGRKFALGGEVYAQPQFFLLDETRKSFFVESYIEK